MIWSSPRESRTLSLFAELKRRNVFRATAAYVAVSWLVIQVAEATFPAFGLTDAALRTLIVLLAVGLVPAVALSWVFEITPEGLKRDADLEPGGELSRRTNRLLDRGIVIVLAIGLAYFAIDKFVLDPARDAENIEQAQQRGRTEALVESYGDNSIAVLPFTNMSADPEQEYFGDGMAEEVLNLLAQVRELRVISRSSAFAYKGKDLKLSQVAEELNVAHILEGSVRRAGNRIRVTAQLIEARSDTHLWSQTWDRELEDIFAIQDEIAAEVVANLKVTLLGELPKAARVNPEAKLLFMQARQILDSMRDGAYAEVHDLLMEAIRLDPEYAEPWTGLSWLNYRCFALRFASATPLDAFCAARSTQEWFALAAEASERALAIDPDNPTANAYQAWNQVFHRKDFQAAADQFRRAVEAAPPSSDVIRSTSIFARTVGRPDLAVRLGEYGVRPRSAMHDVRLSARRGSPGRETVRRGAARVGQIRSAGTGRVALDGRSAVAERGPGGRTRGI
jgi:adenylate cyclase